MLLFLNNIKNVNLNLTHYLLALIIGLPLFYTVTYHTWGWIYTMGLRLCLDNRSCMPWECASRMCLFMLGTIWNCLLAADSRFCEDRRSLTTVNSPIGWKRNELPKKQRDKSQKGGSCFPHHKPLGSINFLFAQT